MPGGRWGFHPGPGDKRRAYTVSLILPHTLSVVSEVSIPDDFRVALLSLRDVQRIPAIHLSEVPAPRALAPYTAALSLHTQEEDHDSPLATGRFVILHDPDSQAGWNGTFRLVAQMRTQIDEEMGADPLLSEAIWHWCHDCLEEAGAGYHSLTGTVTKEVSESYGGLVLTGSRLCVELRASWTPVTPYLGEHLHAWMTLMGRTSGIISPNGELLSVV